MLTLPPCPKLSDVGGPLTNTTSAVIPGVSVDGNHPLRLGLLNFKDTSQPRSANIILWPDHPFWQISTTEELYTYLERSFPQLQYLREAVSEDVAQAFLDAPLAQFKGPQRCGRLVAELPAAAVAPAKHRDRASGLQGSAVCLVGDAAHVFPPGALLDSVI